MSKKDFECQNLIFSRISNIKIGFLMSKFDIRPQFECRNGILNVKICIRPGFECQNRISNVNCDIQSQLECQNRILNVEIRYSASV